MLKRAASYVRVSSGSQQHGFSPETQAANIERYCRAMGFEIAWRFDVQESAFRYDRGGFADLLKLARKRGGPDVIVIDRVDRSARNMLDAAMLERLVDETGVEVHAASENLILAPRGKGSRFAWRINAASAADYSERLSVRVRENMKRKAEGGGWNHRAPLGYRNRRDERRAWVEPDPETAPIIKSAFAQFAGGGLSVAALRESMARTGLECSASAAHSMLRNPFYRGTTSFDGADHPGSHEPLVDPQTWIIVQRLLDSRKRGKGRTKHAHLLGGLITCARCECNLVAYHVTQRHGHAYTYYRCSWGRGRCTGMVREEKLVANIETWLLTHTVPDDAFNELRESIRTQSEAVRKGAASEARRIRESLDRLRRKAALAYDDRLDGKLTAEEHDAMAQAWRRESEELQAKLAAVETPCPAWHEEALRLLDIVRCAHATWLSGDRDTRRRTIRALSRSLTWDGRSLHIEPLEGVEETALAASEHGRLRDGRAGRMLLQTWTPVLEALMRGRIA